MVFNPLFVQKVGPEEMAESMKQNKVASSNYLFSDIIKVYMGEQQTETGTTVIPADAATAQPTEGKGTAKQVVSYLGSNAAAMPAQVVQIPLAPSLGSAVQQPLSADILSDFGNAFLGAGAAADEKPANATDASIIKSATVSGMVVSNFLPTEFTNQVTVNNQDAKQNDTAEQSPEGDATRIATPAKESTTAPAQATAANTANVYVQQNTPGITVQPAAVAQTQTPTVNTDQNSVSVTNPILYTATNNQVIASLLRNVKSPTVKTENFTVVNAQTADAEQTNSVPVDGSQQPANTTPVVSAPAVTVQKTENATVVNAIGNATAAAAQPATPNSLVAGTQQTTNAAVAATQVTVSKENKQTPTVKTVQSEIPQTVNAADKSSQVADAAFNELAQKLHFKIVSSGQSTNQTAKVQVQETDSPAVNLANQKITQSANTAANAPVVVEAQSVKAPVNNSTVVKPGSESAEMKASVQQMTIDTKTVAVNPKPGTVTEPVPNTSAAVLDGGKPQIIAGNATPEKTITESLDTNIQATSTTPVAVEKNLQTEKTVQPAEVKIAASTQKIVNAQTIAVTEKPVAGQQQKAVADSNSGKPETTTISSRPQISVNAKPTELKIASIDQSVQKNSVVDNQSKQTGVTTTQNKVENNIATSVQEVTEKVLPSTEAKVTDNVKTAPVVNKVAVNNQTPKQPVPNTLRQNSVNEKASSVKPVAVSGTEKLSVDGLTVENAAEIKNGEIQTVVENNPAKNQAVQTQDPQSKEVAVSTGKPVVANKQNVEKAATEKPEKAEKPALDAVETRLVLSQSRKIKSGTTVADINTAATDADKTQMAETKQAQPKVTTSDSPAENAAATQVQTVVEPVKKETVKNSSVKNLKPEAEEQDADLPVKANTAKPEDKPIVKTTSQKKESEGYPVQQESKAEKSVVAQDKIDDAKRQRESDAQPVNTSANETVKDETLKAPAKQNEPIAVQGTKQTQNVGSARDAALEPQAPMKTIKAVEVAKEIQQLIESKQKGTMTFQLDPENLGKMKVVLTQVEQAISAKIEVASESARQALEQNVQQLYKQMEGNGVQVHSVQITLQQQEQRQPKQQSGKKKLYNFDDENISAENDAAKKELGYNTVEYVV